MEFTDVEVHRPQIHRAIPILLVVEREALHEQRVGIAWPQREDPVRRGDRAVVAPGCDEDEREPVERGHVVRVARYYGLIARDGIARPSRLDVGLGQRELRGDVVRERLRARLQGPEVIRPWHGPGDGLAGCAVPGRAW